jgi:hypothetical protein
MIIARVHLTAAASALAFDDPTIDDDLRRVLEAHEIVLGGEWPDVW